MSLFLPASATKSHQLRRESHVVARAGEARKRAMWWPEPVRLVLPWTHHHPNHSSAGTGGGGTRGCCFLNEVCYRHPRSWYGWVKNNFRVTLLSKHDGFLEIGGISWQTILINCFSLKPFCKLWYVYLIFLFSVLFGGKYALLMLFLLCLLEAAGGILWWFGGNRHNSAPTVRVLLLFHFVPLYLYSKGHWYLYKKKDALRSSAEWCQVTILSGWSLVLRSWE